MKEKINILIVDDESEARHSMAEMLEMAGYRVASVPGGDAALKHLQENKTDLVICDIVMPGMDGYAVLERVKDTFPAVNVIMITGNGDAGAVRKAFRMGADEFITKPFDIQALGLIIQRVCWNLEMEEG